MYFVFGYRESPSSHVSIEKTSSMRSATEIHQRYSALSIRIDTIPVGGAKLRFKSPQYFFPELTDSNLMIVRQPSLGIDVFGESASELRELIVERLGVLWTMYMSRSDDQLTPKARKVKQNLRELLTEVNDG